MKIATIRYCFSTSLCVPAAFFIFLIMLLVIPVESVAQDAEIRPSREAAERLYSSGEYLEALLHYNLLIEKFPADPLYKYFAGVCLVKIEKEPIVATELLTEAIKKSSQIRNVPIDGWFYLGRAHQLSGSFSEAGSSYDLFREKVRKKEVKEYDVDRYISE